MNAIDIYIQAAVMAKDFLMLLQKLCLQTPCIVTNVGDAASVVGKQVGLFPQKIQ